MTVVAINQPAYLPWDGWFDRVRQSDIFIVLDHVQFEKGSATNRVQIRQRDGRPMWLTVPVEKGKPINQTRVIGHEWQRKHRTALVQAYPGCPIAIAAHGYLESLLRDTTRQLADLLDINTSEWLYSTALKPIGVKSDLVLNLCRTVDASVYLSGPHGRDYLDLPSFDKAGIEVRFHDYPVEHPVLSALDGLFRAKVTA